ncbi:hypothetical protein IJU97_04980 [bacterium]|nr:hypothetical protein [bacterium]
MFSSWEAQGDAPAAENGKFVTGNYEYLAQWTANHYQIQFNAND